MKEARSLGHADALPLIVSLRVLAKAILDQDGRRHCLWGHCGRGCQENERPSRTITNHKRTSQGKRSASGFLHQGWLILFAWAKCCDFKVQRLCIQLPVHGYFRVTHRPWEVTFSRSACMHEARPKPNYPKYRLSFPGFSAMSTSHVSWQLEPMVSSSWRLARVCLTPCWLFLLLHSMLYSIEYSIRSRFALAKFPCVECEYTFPTSKARPSVTVSRWGRRFKDECDS